MQYINFIRQLYMHVRNRNDRVKPKLFGSIFLLPHLTVKNLETTIMGDPILNQTPLTDSCLHGRRQGGAGEGHGPPGFSHSLFNLPNFKNSFIFSSLNWLYSYWPSPENFSADALGRLCTHSFTKS